MRIKQQNFCMSDAMPFQQHFEARTEEDIEAAMSDPEALLDVRSNLKVGDRIAICSYERVEKRGANADGLRGFGYVRVLDITKEGVTTIPEAPPVRVVPVIHEQPTVHDGLIVKQLGPMDGNGFAVVDANGNIVERFRKKAEAMTYAGIRDAA